jgi:hypothetical protein
MNLKEKDNLTDVVENLPKVEGGSDNGSSQGEQQVSNNSGENITLGNGEAENRAI